MVVPMINLDLNVWYGCACFVFSCALSYYLGPKGEKLIVFDYMPKGSLASFLHRDIFSGVGPLAISAAKIVKLIWKEISSLINLIGRLRGGETHVDIACDPELVNLALSLTSCPVCVSSVDRYISAAMVLL
ncbi:hypothetical protein RIF29_30042 [Crotalaria pallida]|uniref:Uncharacterized protein ycf23 n=1 Tax=Crotalaria pallida TaxID=3830 RepID=A0AAN9EG42_CROPI